MELFGGILGMVGFVVAAQALKEVKALKERVSRLEGAVPGE